MKSPVAVWALCVSAGLLGGVALGGVAVRLAEEFMREHVSSGGYVFVMFITGAVGAIGVPFGVAIASEARP